MIHLFMGDDAFRNSVSNYLIKYKYKNAVQDDLWNSMTEMARETDTIPKNSTIKSVCFTNSFKFFNL